MLSVSDVAAASAAATKLLPKCCLLLLLLKVLLQALLPSATIKPPLRLRLQQLLCNRQLLKLKPLRSCSFHLWELDGEILELMLLLLVVWCCENVVSLPQLVAATPAFEGCVQANGPDGWLGLPDSLLLLCARCAGHQLLESPAGLFWFSQWLKSLQQRLCCSQTRMCLTATPPAGNQ
jgi:hypothetical protein